jgi:hypothetical protein
MNNFIKKLNVNENQFQELLYYSNKIQEVAYDIYPEIEKAATWAVCKNYYNFALTLIEKNLNQYPIPKLTWEKISSCVPNLDTFVKKWNLIPAYGTGTTQVNTHRHIQPKYSGWTLTMFLENTKNGIVKFHKPESNQIYDEEDFEFRKDEKSQIIESENILLENSVYSIYSKQWHSWELDDGVERCRYSLFQFDNSASISSIKMHLKELKLDA